MVHCWCTCTAVKFVHTFPCFKGVYSPNDEDRDLLEDTRWYVEGVVLNSYFIDWMYVCTCSSSEVVTIYGRQVNLSRLGGAPSLYALCREWVCSSSGGWGQIRSTNHQVSWTPVVCVLPDHMTWFRSISLGNQSPGSYPIVSWSCMSFVIGQRCMLQIPSAVHAYILQLWNCAGFGKCANRVLRNLQIAQL